ncbi:MAG: NAD(P)-dependent oxidoreductase [Oscillospiraceae bacterium]|nr:NAD(P)-dependent oxidoreductase [Oscillospiraceae bacterium]
MKQRVLITGITGYIGSHLARRLANTYEVFGLVRQPVRIEYLRKIEQNVTLLSCDGSYESIERALRSSEAELVFHLAAHYTGGHGAVETPILIESNITFGGYLLEAMANCGCKNLIYTTSVMEHYQGKAYHPVNLYAATKRAFFDLLTYYANIDLIHYGGLVLSDTYGPEDHRPKILNLIYKAAKEKRKMNLSAGTQDYDLVHIDDVVDAFVMAGEQLIAGQWRNQVYQVCSADPLTLKETVCLMDEIIGGIQEAVVWGVVPPSPQMMDKAVRVASPLPGWRQKIDLRTGLKCYEENW